MQEKHKFLLQQLAIGAVVLFVLAFGGLAVREALKTPAGDPPVNDEMEMKLADLQKKTDAHIAARKKEMAEAEAAKAKDETEEKKAKVAPPKDGLLVTHAWTNKDRTQVGFNFYYPESKMSYLDQHKAFSDHWNEMCKELGSAQSGGIWVPLNKNDQIGRPTTHWMSVYNFDEGKSTLKNVPIEVRIEKGVVAVTTHVTQTQEHRKLMEPALRKLAKAAEHPVDDAPNWVRVSDTEWHWQSKIWFHKDGKK